MATSNNYTDLVCQETPGQPRKGFLCVCKLWYSNNQYDLFITDGRLIESVKVKINFTYKGMMIMFRFKILMKWVEILVGYWGLR